jgi:hypothetical protein
MLPDFEGFAVVGLAAGEGSDAFGVVGSAVLAASLAAGVGSCFFLAGGSETPGVSSNFASLFQLSFIFIEDYFCYRDDL